MRTADVLRFVNANAQSLKEFKVAREYLIGRSAADFVVAEKQELSQARFKVTRHGNAVSYDSAVTDGGGERVEISIILIPMKSGSIVTSILGIGRNITAQKRSKWKLQESRNMLQMVIDHLPQRVFWKDTNFAYLGCNDALAADAGLAHRDQIVGRTDYNLAWRASADAYRKEDIETLSSGVAKINYEEQQRRKDGSTSWLRTSKMPLCASTAHTWPAKPGWRSWCGLTSPFSAYRAAADTHGDAARAGTEHREPIRAGSSSKSPRAC